MKEENEKTTSSLSILKDEKPSPWYSQGLRFECTQCGQCCTGAPGYTWVTEGDIQKIANYLNITIDECREKYVRQVGKEMALLENLPDYDCIFLKDNKCQIYQVRPKQCRTFPWWHSNLKTPDDWQRAATFCEGIGKGEVVPAEVIGDQLWKGKL